METTENLTIDEISKAISNRIVKANEIVQKAKYDMSTQSQKLILYIISLIKPDDEELHRYSIPLRLVCEIMGIKDCGANYKRLRDSLSEASDCKLWIFYPEINTWKEIRWIEHIDIELNSSTMSCEIDPRMKPYLINLKRNYTIYDIEEILKMDSKYSIRLFELAKSQLYKGEFRISLLDLKELLCIKGYDDFNNLKKRILDMAVEEINYYTSIYLSYRTERTGRKISHIIFETGLQR